MTIDTNAELKAHIGEARKLMQSALDGKEKDLLGDLLTHIGGGHISEPSHIGEQLDEHAVEFETEHPKLARAIREIMDLLNKMGV